MRGYRTKKISLPGGRVIEIVYFSEPGEDVADATTAAVRDALDEDEAPTASAPEPIPLHVCPACAGDLVYPITWEESSNSAWRIERRCPNCEWRHVGEYSDDDLIPFDEALNDGTETLLVALHHATRANMEAAVERMIDAIRLDLIEPMDF